MALSPAEKQRRYRERQKEKARSAIDPTDELAELPFSEHVNLEEDWGDWVTTLEWAGINPDGVLNFENDDDPGHWPETDGPNRRSIGRAERMVGVMLDSAQDLASMINRYKRGVLDRAIAELEATDMANPIARKATLHEIVRLTNYRDQLDKSVRRDIPQWRVKGD